MCENSIRENSIRENSRYENSKYENLVFEGGGIKAIGQIGAIQALSTRGYLKNIKRYAGSSAGAILATCLAIGYTPNDIKDIFLALDVSSLGENTYKIVQIYNFFKYYGLHKMINLKQWYSTLIRGKMSIDTTFSDLYNITGNELVIVTTCVNKILPIYMNHITHPTTRLVDALELSTSFPGYFTPIRIGSDIYADGGVLDNYPIWIFNDLNMLYNGKGHEISKILVSPLTLGLKLCSTGENNTKQMFYGSQPIYSIYTYGAAMINSMSIQIERSNIDKSYEKHTIPIYTGNTPVLDWNITLRKKAELLMSGYEAVKKWESC